MIIFYGAAMRAAISSTEAVRNFQNCSILLNTVVIGIP